MKLGLTYPQVPDPPTRSALETITSTIGAGYGKQHNADDTHSTITATGSISERKRTTAMGVWATLSFLATYYTASSSTWTVTAAQQVTLKYMLIGTTLFVTFNIVASSVGGTPASLMLTLPLNARSSAIVYGSCSYNDNGTLGTGVILCNTGTTSPQLTLRKVLDGSVAWSTSAALTIAGTIAFDVSGSI